MTTFTDGTPPSVTPGPDEGPGSRRSDRPADTGPEWLREEMQRRLAESPTSSGGRHARRDSAAGPATPVGYVPRHSVATPGPAAPAPRPVGGPAAAGGGYGRSADRPDAPAAWSGPRTPGASGAGPNGAGPNGAGGQREDAPVTVWVRDAPVPFPQEPRRSDAAGRPQPRPGGPRPGPTGPRPTDSGPQRAHPAASGPFPPVVGHPRPLSPHDAVQAGPAQAGPAVEVPAPRRPEPGDTRTTDLEDTDVQSRRVRVVLAERKGLARPVRTVVDIQEGTGVGALLRSNLIGSQLAVALRFALGAGLTLGLLPLLFALVPAIGQVEVLGLRLPWLLLGVLVYPFLLGLGYWHTRTAERVEQDFADDVQG